MNIINAISRNEFLKEIYPEGFAKDVLIGDIGFHPSGRFSLELHVRQKPAKEVLKWGVWGSDFNIVIVCLAGRFVEDISISNWESVDFAPMVGVADGDKCSVTSSGDAWSIKFSFKSLVFQNCKTYFSE